jgi:hypothetical protein
MIHKAEWEFIKYIENGGIISKVDVDKYGNEVSGMDTTSIIVGKKNKVIIPTENYKCKKCGIELNITRNYFTGVLELPKYH